MGKHNYRLLGIILGLAIVTILTTSYAFASDMRIALEQKRPPALRGDVDAIDLRGSTNISRKNPKITLSLKNTDVKPVLRMFADKAGVNLVLHPSVNGFVNLDLVNVPLNDAFRMVLQITDLTYTQDGNTIIVSATDYARSSGISKQAITTIPVNYVDASLIANFLNQNIFSKKTPGLSNWDVVVTNAARNELLVFGTANDLAMVKKVVAKFDVPPLNTTFTVKHTTPAEMAELVCRMLQMTDSPLDQNSQTTQRTIYTPEADTTEQNNLLNNPINNLPSGLPTGLAANIKNTRKIPFFSMKKGSVTGFASSSSSGSKSSGGSSGSKSSGGSSSSSSSSSSSGSSSGSGIALGRSVVACTLGSSSNSNSGSGSKSGSGSSSSGSSGSSSSSKGSSSSGSSGGNNGMKLASLGTQKMVISYFPQRGTINVLGGTKTIVDRISAYIQENDVKQPQALMDITVLELNETGSKDLTNAWHFKSKNIDISFDSDKGVAASVPIGPSSSPQNVFTKTIGAPQLQWLITYIITNNKGRIVANPKILITNGETSSIDLTSEYIDTVDAEIITSSIGTSQGVERTYNKGSDLGLQFDLVPFISPEGYISLNFDAEYSTQKEQINASLTGSSEKELVATLLNKRTVNLTNIRVKDNETLYIGGLVNENETKSVSKIPLLGDLPVVGVAFRSTSVNREKSELVILLTPRILKDSEDISTGQEADTL